MWFPDEPAVDWSVAQRRLARVDPVMRAIIKRVGPCTLAPRRDYFVKLAQSIYSQQISTAVARVLFNRLRDRFPNRRPTPAGVVKLLEGADEATVKAIGLSRQKKAYLLDLARRFASGEIKTRRFASMDDEAIVQALIPIKGIGRWTVEMFLIFCLNRTDVYPIDDFGVKKGIQRAYGFEEMPTKAQMIEIGEKWRPWRTVASWYLWRSLDAAKPEAKV
jgi:DNA-3-methyladenine glycosylase II